MDSDHYFEHTCIDIRTIPLEVLTIRERERENGSWVVSRLVKINFGNLIQISKVNFKSLSLKRIYCWFRPQRLVSVYRSQLLRLFNIAS